MEELVDEGLVRDIGMSNLPLDMLKIVVEGARIKPSFA